MKPQKQLVVLINLIIDKKDIMQVKVKMKEGCEDLFPTKAHHDDAAFDLRAAMDMDICRGDCLVVPTGIFIELPPGYELQVRSRSGIALKKKVIVANGVGTIDAGYRGEVGVILMALGDVFEIKRGDRIAQGVICKLPEVELIPATELSETVRGGGGFGSTGK